MIAHGSAFPVAKLALNNSVPPILMASLRMGLVFIILIPFWKFKIPKKKYLKSVVLTGALATYLANYIQKHLWIAYIGLGFILLVALQLVIGGLNDYGVLSINETFKKYF